MTKTIIKTDKAPEPMGPYSQAIKANGFLFLSGQIPIDPKTGQIITGTFEEQCRLVLNNLQAVIEAGGSTLDDVVKVNIFLSDIEKFAEMNTIYNEYFGTSKPARACIEAARLPKDVEVEIEATAICP